MARTTKVPADSPAFWPLEADPADLQAYVDARLGTTTDVESASDEPQPDEPSWFREAFDALWHLILAEARFSSPSHG